VLTRGLAVSALPRGHPDQNGRVTCRSSFSTSSASRTVRFPWWVVSAGGESRQGTHPVARAVRGRRGSAVQRTRHTDHRSTGITRSAGDRAVCRLPRRAFRISKC